MIDEIEKLWRDVQVGDVIVRHDGFPPRYLEVMEIKFRDDELMRVKTGVITSRGLKNFDTATAPLDSRCDILIGGIEAARKMLMMQEM
jgi:hypothetical protein